MMPFILAEEGEWNTIKKTGGTPEVKRHLETLGFTEGSDVMIVGRVGDNVIARVKDSRIAISGEMARKIMI